MDNEFLTPQMIAREALIRLKNQLRIANEVYRDYSDEFAQVGDTVTVRKPATFTADEFDDQINLQDIGEGKVPVKLDTILDVSVEATSREMSLSINDFGSQVLDGAILAIAEGINNRVAKVGSQEIPYFTGTPGDTPDSLRKGFTNPRKKMNINQVPASQRKLFFDPEAEAELLNIDTVVKANESGSTDALREASMGRIMGFETYMDQAITTHKAGDYTSLDDVSVTAVSHSSDDAFKSVLTLESDAGASTDSLKAGDLFEVEGKQYAVVTNTSDASSGAISNVEVYPKFHKDKIDELDDASVTFVDKESGGHTSNLAFHKNAIALVSRPLELPMGKTSETAYVVEDPNTGLALRVVMDYDINEKKSVISIDTLIGTKVLYPTLGVQILG